MYAERLIERYNHLQDVASCILEKIVREKRERVGTWNPNILGWDYYSISDDLEPLSRQLAHETAELDVQSGPSADLESLMTVALRKCRLRTGDGCALAQG